MGLPTFYAGGGPEAGTCLPFQLEGSAEATGMGEGETNPGSEATLQAEPKGKGSCSEGTYRYLARDTSPFDPPKSIWR